MAQPFRLSAAPRTLSLRAVFLEGEAAAHRRFRRLRRPETDGAPVCPACGRLGAHDLTTRRRFECAACRRRFGVTPETIFASRKLSFVDPLAAIRLAVNAAKGVSAAQPFRDLDVRHKTAFVPMHKLREAMAAETRDARRAGRAEMDGAFFGGRVRPSNAREDRVDVGALRPEAASAGSRPRWRRRGGRTPTRTFLRKAEGAGFARERIAPGAVVSAEEAAHWDPLAPDFDAKRINPSDACSRNGVRTNLAESFFPRLRRMIRGQRRKAGGKRLGACAAHAAWLEDRRRTSNGPPAGRLIGAAPEAPVGRTWKGCRRRRAAPGRP